jgi:hypothetical protein
MLWVSPPHTSSIHSKFLILNYENKVEMRSTEFSIALILSIMFSVALLYVIIVVSDAIHWFLLKFFSQSVSIGGILRKLVRGLKL